MKRSKFSLSHYHMTTVDQGLLVPISWYEALPGDSIQASTTALIRAAPLASPVMHPVHARIHHWFVPLRILWDGFESFITGGPTGTDTTVRPYLNINGTITVADRLLNYLGVPLGTYTNFQVSALPLRAYQMIYNEWYRDQDLVTPATFSTANGLDGTTATTIQRVAWEKDYYTSSRPWAQKGTASSVGITVTTPQTQRPRFINPSTGAALSGAVTGEAVTGDVQVGGVDALIDPFTTMRIDMNALRESAGIQRYMEARARWGSRYSEYLRYLGVKSSDARLQRPEYLGGGKQTIQFSEVLQTAEGTDPVGMMRGHGIGALKSNRWRRFFEEHGIVMTLLSIKPKSVYMQAMHKQWFRETKEMYWQKELQHLGQQVVGQKEIYAPSGAASLFGYQDRYDEYRHHPSRVSGEFADTLKYWHMARDFASLPALNASFVNADPTNRVYAATTAAQMYVMAMHSIQARRMVAKRGTSVLM